MKVSISYFTIALLLLCQAVFSQNAKNKYQSASEAILKSFKEMIEDPTIVLQPNNNVVCDPMDLMEEFDKAALIPQRKPFEDYLKYILEDYNKKLNGLQTPIPLVGGDNLTDKILRNITPKKRFKAFAEAVTGEDIINIQQNDKLLLIDFFMNHPLKKGIAGESKNGKPVKARFQSCIATSVSKLIPQKWKFPDMVWALETKVTIVCDCDANSIQEVDQAVLEYNTITKGKLSFNQLSFQPTKRSSLGVESVQCCGMDEPEEEASIQIDPTENISLPNQMIGGNVGVGFAESFEEISVCVGVEYLHNISEIGNSHLFVGANAAFETTSFMDFNSTWVSAGPTVQLFSPLGQNQLTQVTNGLSGNVLFGSTDNNGFKNDVSGFEIVLNSGLNVQLNANTSLSLIIPIVTHQSLTFEAQDGGAIFETDDTVLLLNKANPVKIGLRFGF